MRILTSLLFSAALTIAHLSTAQAATGLLEIYHEAQRNDPQLQQAASNRLAQHELLPQARALELPNLSGQGTFSRNFVGNSNRSDYNSHNYGLFLDQPIYNRGNQVRVRQARVTRKQADVDYTTAKQNLILRVAQAYFDVLSAEADVTYAKANKEAIGRQLEQAKRRFDVGLATITDVQDARARYDQANATEIQNRNTLSDTKEALRQITGRYYPKLRDVKDKIPMTMPKPAKLKYWIDQALKHNPGLESASYAADIAHQSIQLQRSDHYPTLDFTASYSDSDNGILSQRGGAIGLQLNVPIYQGGAINSRTREAAYKYEAAKQNREQVQRALVRQVQDAYRSIQNSISLVSALKQATVSGRSSLKATEAGYQVGTRTIVDVLNSQSALLGSERDYAKARYNYLINKLSLKQAAGNLSEADLDRIERLLRNK